MAKDPAIMFYAQDFLVGTVFMTNEQVGIYIRLLCYQHQHGGIIDKESFNSLCGCNTLVKGKFIETDDGFFNKRLADEMMKRSVKSSNMSDVAKKRWNGHTKAMLKHNKSNAKAYANVMLCEDEDRALPKRTTANIDNNTIKLKRVSKEHQAIAKFCEKYKSATEVDYVITNWAKQTKNMKLLLSSGITADEFSNCLDNFFSSNIGESSKYSLDMFVVTINQWRTTNKTEGRWNKL